jgi:choline dehydrogenase-like flavoprotein
LTRVFELPNLFVIDASTPVTSAAANPSLSVASLSMRTAAHILETDLARSGIPSTNNQPSFAFSFP